MTLGEEIDINKVIIIFDRGYPSLEMIYVLQEIGIKYIFRGQTSSYKKRNRKNEKRRWRNRNKNNREKNKKYKREGTFILLSITEYLSNNISVLGKYENSLIKLLMFQDYKSFILLFSILFLHYFSLYL